MILRPGKITSISEIHKTPGWYRLLPRGELVQSPRTLIGLPRKPRYGFQSPMLTPVQLAIVALMVNDQTRAQQIDPNKGYTQVPEILTKMHAQYGLHPMHELDTLLEYEVIELPPQAPNAILACR